MVNNIIVSDKISVPCAPLPHAKKALYFARYLGGSYQLIQEFELVKELYKTILFIVGSPFQEYKRGPSSLVNNVMLSEEIFVPCAPMLGRHHALLDT